MPNGKHARTRSQELIAHVLRIFLDRQCRRGESEYGARPDNIKIEIYQPTRYWLLLAERPHIMVTLRSLAEELGSTPQEVAQFGAVVTTSGLTFDTEITADAADIIRGAWDGRTP